MHLFFGAFPGTGFIPAQDVSDEQIELAVKLMDKAKASHLFVFGQFVLATGNVSVLTKALCFQQQKLVVLILTLDLIMTMPTHCSMVTLRQRPNKMLVHVPASAMPHSGIPNIIGPEQRHPSPKFLPSREDCLLWFFEV